MTAPACAGAERDSARPVPARRAPRLAPAFLCLALLAALLTSGPAAAQTVVSFAHDAFSLPENNGPVSPVMHVSPPSAVDIELYFTLGGTASPGGHLRDFDFPVPAVLKAAPGGVASFSIPFVADGRDEPDETIVMTLDTSRLPPGVTAGTIRTATVTIVDTDPTVVVLAQRSTGSVVSEGAAVELSVALGRALVAGEVVDVPLAVSGAGVTTADWSLAKKPGSGLNTGVTLSGETTATPKVRFSGAGARTATLVLTAAADAVAEPGGETLTVALGPDGAGANGFDHASLGTNVGNGAGPHPTYKTFSVRVHDTTVGWAARRVEVGEGAGTVRLTLELSAARATATAVPLLYAASDAREERDFRRGPASVTIAAGATRATVDVPIVDDALVEGEEEFAVLIDKRRLPPGVGVAVDRDGAREFAHVTIVDNEADPVVTLAAASTAAVTEGTPARFTLRVAPAPGAPLAVEVAVADAPGADFVAGAGEGARTVTLPEGATSVDFTVATTPDTTDEPSGAVTAAVAAGEGYGRPEDAAPARVRVRDDDATAVVLSVPDAKATEGDASDTAALVLDIGRGLRAGERLSVPLQLTGGALGTDFTLALAGAPRGVALTGTTVVFTGAAPASASSATVRLAAADDADTAHETVTVSLGTLAATGLDGGTAPRRTGAGRIALDDDDAGALPAVTVTAGAPVVEGAPATFTLTASPAPAARLTVNLSVADDATSDFLAAGTEGARTVTLPTSGTATVTVATAGDATDEADGAVTVTVATGGGYTPGTPASAQVTVHDDDGTPPPLPVLSITGGPAVTEGTAARFTVTARPVPAPRTTLTVNIGVEDAPGADFLAASLEGENGVWYFQGGAATRTFTLATQADRNDEPGGPVTVTLRPRSTYTVGTPASASVTVNDDDDPPGGAPTVRLSGATYAVTEGGAASVTVNIAPRRTAATTLGLACTHGTTAGADLSACPTSVTIPANAAAHTVSIQTTGDSEDEPAETFTVALGTLPAGVALGRPSSATVTLTDDDPTPVTLSVPDATAAEGDATDTAAIDLDIGRGLTAGERLSAPLQFTGGAAGTDFTLALAGAPRGVTLTGTTVVFAGGTTPSAASARVLLSASPDRDTTDETVTVSLGTLAATGLDGGVLPRRTGDGRMTLEDASTPVTVLSISTFPPSIPAAGMPEGATFLFHLNLNRTLAAGETVTFPLTLGGTAVRGTDYRLACGTTAGVSCSNLVSGTPSLTVDGARIRIRTVTSALSLTALEDNAPDAARSVALGLGGSTRSFDIVDAPDAVTITFTRATLAVRENNGPAEPVMRITPAPGRDIPLHFTLGGTATEGRTGAGDYHFSASPIVVAAGTPAHAIVINLSSANSKNPVVLDEPDETVVLTLDTSRLPSWVTPGAITVHTLTILDADPTVVSLARSGSGAVTEGGTVTFTVTLGRALGAGEVIDVPLAVSGTGVAPADFGLALKAGTDLNTGVTLSRADTATPRLRFAGAGARTATLELVPVDDGLDEGGETFTVALGPDGAGANGFDRSGLGTNVGGGADPHATRHRFAVAVREGPTRARQILVTPGPSVAEGTAAAFTLTADPVAPVSDLAVTVTVADAPGADFLAAGAEGARTVTIPAGQTSVDFTVATTPDTTDEPSGPVTATVTAAAGYETGATGAVRVTDDDRTPVTLSVLDATATEGGIHPHTDTAATARVLGRGLHAGERLVVPLEFTGGAVDTDFTLVLRGSPAGVTLTGTTVVFTGGTTPSTASATVYLYALSDADTTDETVTVSLGTLAATGLDGGTAPSRTGDGRITLEDVALTAERILSFSVPSTGLPEGATALFGLELSRVLAVGETVTFPLTLGGVAERGTDYRLACGPIAGITCHNFASGDPSLTLDGARIRTRSPGTTLLLTAVGDDTAEAAEGVELTLGGLTRSFDIVDAPTAVEIEFTRNSREVGENNFDPCMRITPPSGRDIPLHFTISSDSTATEGRTGEWDYYFKDDPPVLERGRSFSCFPVLLNADALDEPTETIVMTLDESRLPSGVTLKSGASPTFTASIFDRTPTPVSLARTGAGAVTEGGTVTFTVTLGRALRASAVLEGGTADEVVGVPLAVSGTGVTPGDFSLALKTGTGLNTGVTLSLADTATPRLVFAGAGARVATLELVPTDDGLDEGGETFTVALGPARGGANAFDHGALGTNADGGAAPHATRHRFDVAVREGRTSPRSVRVAPGAGVPEGTAAAFTLTASPAPASDLAVTVTIADAPGADFLAAGAEGARTVTIPAGRASVRFTVETMSDTYDEPGGPVTATVTAAAGYATGATGAVTVTDDDPTTVALSGSPSAIVEAGGEKKLTLALGRALVEGERLDVPVVVGGTARYPADYGMYADGAGVGGHLVGRPGGFVHFIGGPDASRTATLHVTAVDDALDEGVSETVTVGLGTLDARSGTNLGGGASGSGAVAFVIADDDDPLPVATLAGGGSVTEGTPATFTVTVDRALAAALDIAVDVADATESDFLDGAAEGRRTVTLAAGATTVDFTVATTPDDTDEPDAPVRATLAHGEGYARGDPATATVTVTDDDATTGPTLSIADATLAEGEGQLRHTRIFPGPNSQMRFTVRLSAAQPHTVRVSARTRPSTPVSARPRHDYYPMPHLFTTFRPGQTVSYFYIFIHDDSIDEPDETFELVLFDARGAAIADAVAVGTITNDDPMPAAYLARFGRTVAEQALEGVAGRMAAPRTPGMRGTLAGRALDFGGAAGDPAAPGAIAQALGSEPDHDAPGLGAGLGETMTARDALLGSSFTLTGEADASGGSMAFWGRASQGSFEGSEGTFSLDGEVTTGLLGADYARDRWLIGLALARSAGEGGYRDTRAATPSPGARDCPDATPCEGAVRAGDGKVEARLSAVLPYASLDASERLTLWGAAGLGEGDVTLETATGGRYRADTTWRMAAAGLRGALLEAPGEGSGPALALTSDALWARTASERTRDLAASSSDVTRLRLGLEGSYRLALEGDSHLTPALELGARHDGGDAETGLGIELGAGLAWSDPARGLSLDVSGRTLLAHEDGDLADRGVSAAFGFDPRPETERGLSLSLRQALGGQATGGLDALFAPAPLEERTGGGEATSRWTAQAAYGLPAFGGRYTASPHVGLGRSAGTREYTLGWRWTPAQRATDLSFGVKATRSESGAAAPEHTVGLEAAARW